MKTILFLLLSSTAFAQLGAPLSRQEAAKTTRLAREQAVFESIYETATGGDCTLDAHLDSTLVKKLKKLGYEVTSDEKGSYLITWCE